MQSSSFSTLESSTISTSNTHAFTTPESSSFTETDHDKIKFENQITETSNPNSVHLPDPEKVNPINKQLIIKRENKKNYEKLLKDHYNAAKSLKFVGISNDETSTIDSSQKDIQSTSNISSSEKTDSFDESNLNTFAMNRKRRRRKKRYKLNKANSYGKDITKSIITPLKLTKQLSTNQGKFKKDYKVYYYNSNPNKKLV